QSGPDLSGKAITVDGSTYTIVGVAPGGFDPIDSFRESPVYLPIGQWNNPALNSRDAGLGIHGVGRLRPGVSIQQARANMDEVTQELAAEYPKEDNEVGATLIPLTDQMLGEARRPLIILLAAVGFVLLIACLNVANLMLARSNSREREFAIRATIGAGRLRLIRQLLTESVLLGCGGGLLGVILAAWGTQAALKRLPDALPRSSNVGIDSRVLVFTALISLMAGVAFGLFPALKTVRSSLQSTLKETGRSFSSARHRAQSVLVTIEVALALVLLIGAGLMIRTMSGLWRVNPGFDPSNVVVFSLWLPPSADQGSPDSVREAYRNLDREMMGVPGVRSVSASGGGLPLWGEDDGLFLLDGQPKPASDNDMNWSLSYVVEPDYLSVMRIPVKRGRFFTARDDLHSPLVVVVDEVFAAHYFSGADPVGKRIYLARLKAMAEIVGVVGHVKQWAIGSETGQLQAQMYTPFAQIPDSDIVSPGADFVVRSDAAGLGIVDAIRSVCKRISGDLVIANEVTMDAVVARQIARAQFSMILLSFFAGLAMLLAAIGVFGVVSYWVGQRTHEIGVRVALGAERSRVLTLILFQGAAMALPGVGIGLVSALGLTRLLTDMLYGVSPSDPLTFGVIATVLTCVSLVACYIPACRATRVDPAVALRHE
ncbi:MAG TPA: ABC transporter permease, partial [Blastocatellia bacterium]